MINWKTIFIFSLSAVAFLLWVYPVKAYSGLSLALDILSSKDLNGTAGDYVTVQGQITNTSQQPLADITTYLSLVDNENKLPVDLEDWSAEKGLFIGTIEAGQTLPLNWKIHFVKAGDYSLVVVATSPTSETPQVSKITHFHVSPKHNLNPGKILPVALGMPILLLFIMAMINYKRQKEQVRQE
jgi:hypothetical protein